MTTLLYLDEFQLANICDFLCDVDIERLRATCRSFRTRIRATSKRSPLKCLRWALRHNRARNIESAIDAGARELLRYTGNAFTFARARELWYDRAHAFDSGVSRDDLLIVSQLLNGSIRIDDQLNIPETIKSGIVARYVGKLSSDSMVHKIFAELVRLPLLSQGLASYFVGGIIKSGRDALAAELIRYLVENRMSCCAIRGDVAKIGPISREYIMSSRDVYSPVREIREALREQDDAFDVATSDWLNHGGATYYMRDAVAQGNFARCTHLRSHWRTNGGNFNHRLIWIADSFSSITRNGDVKMFEYLRDWYTEMRENIAPAQRKPLDLTGAILATCDQCLYRVAWRICDWLDSEPEAQLFADCASLHSACALLPRKALTVGEIKMRESREIICALLRARRSRALPREYL